MLFDRFSLHTHRIPTLCVVAALAVVGGCGADNAPDIAAETPARADTEQTSEEIYVQYCASCHGVTGVGDGPAATELRVAPPNLRLLARRNGGKFPIPKVKGSIDGRGMPHAHGSALMPVWGRQWQREGATPQEVDIQVRVIAITNFLRSIQD